MRNSNFTTFGKNCLLALCCFLFTSSLLAQTEIKGNVKDSSGLALSGVNVIVKGTDNGTVTDFDGNYKISVNEAQTAVLVYSFLGFQTQEVLVANRSEIDIVLIEDTTQLEDIVIIGYGNVKKSDATGAVTSVAAKDFNAGVTLSPQQLLQGKAAGVNISQANGQPGAKTLVRIRGVNSINGKNDPLYVVDGVPLNFQESDFGVANRSSRESTNPLNMINPDDIERIDILKDASALAIYGSRASNGVIIITTKKGKIGDAKVEYHAYTGISKLRKKLPVLSADQVRKYASDNNITNFRDGGANTDWQDEIFRNALVTSHSLSMSGGTAKTRYLMSLGHQDQRGIIISSGLKKVTARMNINSKLMNDKLTVNANMLYSSENSDNIPSVSTTGGDGEGDVIRDALRANPTLPIKDPNSPYTGGFTFIDQFVQNPVEQAVLIDDVTLSKRFIGNVSFDYKVYEDLNFITNIGFTQENIEKKSFFPTGSRIGTELVSEGVGGLGSLQYRDNNNRLIETTLNYKKDVFENHNLTALAGYSFQEFENASANISRSGSFIADNLGFDNVSVNQSIGGSAGNGVNDRAIVSFFGRGTYSINNKYIFTGTVRRDGSSNFSPDKQWATFLSGAFAWKIAEEDFMQNTAFSDLKLRLGLGQTGNTEFGNLRNRNTINASSSLNSELGAIALASSIENPDFGWETTTQANIGLDFGLLNGRITGSFDVYRKVTEDLGRTRFTLLRPSVVETIAANVGDVENKGVEFSIDAVVIEKKDFRMSWYGNISANRNKVLNLSNSIYKTPKEGLFTFKAPSPQQSTEILVTREGESLGTLYGLEFIGFGKDGEEQFRDLNNDGEINSDDRKIIGLSQPDFTYGIGTNMKFKQFNFGAFFRGVQGIDVLNSTRNDLESSKSLPNVNALDAVLRNGAVNAPSGQVSSRFIEDASYLRLENITLGYNFDTSNFSFIKNLNLYVTGQNLFVLTEYTGFDPEVNVADFTSYPRPKTFIIGLKAGF